MIYRETGQFKTSYAADRQLFPIRQDRLGMILLLLIAFVGVPLLASPYWLAAILTPFLIFSLAAIGLNLLTGYAGQISLGSAAFMAVGAFASYNFALRLPWIPTLVSFVLGGLCAALVGLLFGLPSARIRGFYLAVATLAAQFFITWCLVKFGWFSNYSSSGAIAAQSFSAFGWAVDSPARHYLVTLSFVVVLSLLAKNLVRSDVGRAWMAVRDRDVAAEVMGISPFKTKLLAFAVSSFYCGVAGALAAYCYLGMVAPDYFTLDLSFRILFMIVIGGMGTILGAFIGAAFIVLIPIVLNNLLPPLVAWAHIPLTTAVAANVESMLFCALIIFTLVVEPRGLARLWQILKEKLRSWPLPH
ncbi:MAG TPA: branched-chain amino acid ABC transporter permease [Rhodocyclaceae bacterium]|nr:branched-chain amino acid ABC transporter permease [Rhodocyclaceae bacterium]